MILKKENGGYAESLKCLLCNEALEDFNHIIWSPLNGPIVRLHGKCARSWGCHLISDSQKLEEHMNKEDRESEREASK